METRNGSEIKVQLPLFPKDPGNPAFEGIEGNWFLLPYRSHPPDVVDMRSFAASMHRDQDVSVLYAWLLGLLSKTEG
jgi:hypothetical protein